ncbi:MAG: cbb3-type cytochrome c oxidase subunit I [Roseibacillus sp.]
MATDSDIAFQKDSELRAKIDRSLRHPVMFLLVSGAAWLAVSLILGFISSTKAHWPTFLDSYGFLSYGRVYAAHINVLVYGWGCQAAFGLVIWLMARLSRKECRAVGVILTAGHLWNFGVLVGFIGILAGYGTGKPWMEFPAAVWPLFLVSYLFISVWSFVQFRCSEGKRIYIAQWYLLAAMFWFPWIYLTGHLFVFVFEGHPVMAAGVNAWFKSAMIYLFFTPVALGTAYYLAPKVTGRPIYSYALAMFGFWSLAAIAPWAGMQKLAGAPLPQFMPYVGAAATVLILIPALAVGVNIVMTIHGHGDAMSASPSLRFITGGIVSFLIMGVLGVFLNTPGALKLTQFSLTGYGYEVLALYGFFSMCAFGGIYFIVPRITRREWLSRRFISWHFLLTVYGVGTVVVCSIMGGFFQGQAQEAYNSAWMDAATRSYAYNIGTTVAWGFILFGSIFFLLHLLLMWARLGRRSQHPTLLKTEHHESSPHGPEGEVDELQTAEA